MENLFLVSYPRSGQHYSQRLIERTTGQDDYCELYHCRVPDCPGKAWPISDRTPCPSGRKVQKTHDFDGKFPVLDDARYAVLLRRPIYSLTSYYEHSTKAGNGLKLGGEVLPDSQEAWEAFVTEKAAYWRDFTAKWVGLAGPSVRIFNYDRLVSDADYIMDFLRFTGLPLIKDKAERLSRKQAEIYAKGSVGHRSTDDFRHDVAPVIAIAERVIPAELIAAAGLSGVS